MKKPFFFTGLLFVFSYVFISGCEQSDKIPPAVYKKANPDYDQLQISATKDTIHFGLTENTYNSIKSFNLFENNGKEYISFYDRRSESISIYDFQTQDLIKIIHLKKWVKQFYKTSVYVKSFDSILITNKTRFYLMDSSGHIHNKINFLEKPRFAWAFFENGNLPVISNGIVYAAVRPYADETSLESMSEWKVLYQFDLFKNKAKLSYPLPELYTSNYYGDRFLDYSYCFNNRNNFVLSFPADTNVYETNMKDIHIAYYGKSKFQVNEITPVSKEFLINDEGSKQYAIRDSYGPIFFDPYRNRYLRQMKQRISEQQYVTKSRSRKESIIIFNENLKIMGESEISGFYFGTIFFSSNGDMYARVNPEDEYNLHFIKLVYSDDHKIQHQLVKSENR